jgi:transcriptional regulator with XRE-family HTH domain
MAQEWSRLLLEARTYVGLPRAELARRASLSPETVRAYEVGRRRPSRQLLTAILDALKVDRSVRNSIQVAAGFAPDGRGLGPQNPDLMFTVEEAAEEVERYRWPAFVSDEMAWLVAANSVAQRLWGVDLRSELTDPVDRHLLGAASSPRFADRCLNWDEVMTIMLGRLKLHHRGPEDPEHLSPYITAVLQRFLQGDRKYVARLINAWQEATPISPKIRWSYPVVWQEPDIGVMRFHAFVSSANEEDGFAFNDWIPVDAESWERLERLLR